MTGKYKTKQNSYFYHKSGMYDNRRESAQKRKINSCGKKKNKLN